MRRCMSNPSAARAHNTAFVVVSIFVSTRPHGTLRIAPTITHLTVDVPFRVDGFPSCGCASDSELDPISDLTQVFLNGQLAGQIDRDQESISLMLPAMGNGSAAGSGAETVVLDVLVGAMGRLNFGCGWDEKGLTSDFVTLDGAMAQLMRPWSVVNKTRED